MNKIKFKVNNDKFGDFLTKLDDLTKISTTIKLKIDNENTLIYSVLGKAAVLAFKNYTLKTKDLFEIKEDLEEDADIFEELVISYFFRRLEYMKHEGFLWKKKDTYSIISDQEQDEILEQLAK
jgi:hypothetical protein